ncbi:hypothetical protein CSB09_03600 [Candidatus Gracilibacteria bacterium]|nr:MAG: hypothetical protein CSB09_03600 [Candidatus Gracilibacteria bacterium]
MKKVLFFLFFSLSFSLSFGGDTYHRQRVSLVGFCGQSASFIARRNTEFSKELCEEKVQVNISSETFTLSVNGQVLLSSRRTGYDPKGFIGQHIVVLMEENLEEGIYVISLQGLVE